MFEMPSGSGDECPATRECQKPGLPPVLPKPYIDPTTPGEHSIQQDAPWIPSVGGAHVRNTEYAGRDKEHGLAPLPPGGDKAETGGHRREVKQQEIGVRVIATEHECSEQPAHR